LLSQRFEQLDFSSRQHPRVAATIPLTYRPVGDSVGRHGRTRDISGGGLSFDTQDMTLDQNATIAISFELRGVRIAARARVIGFSPGSGHDAANDMRTYRVVFADISFETQTLLAFFVVRNSLEAILAKALCNVG
jgi:hypothetical protein